MRSLILLALVALAAIPVSAHDHGRDRRPVVVVESYRPARRWEARRREAPYRCNRWERHSHYRLHDRRYDCDDARILLRPLPRPLAPPLLGRLELRFP
jgi:hypothetical protein